MPLTFPTMAEQAVKMFNTSPRTVSLAKICESMGAERTDVYPVTTYTFEDDTTVTVTGRGRAHKVETHFP